MKMLFTGEMISADEALRIGLVNDLCAPENLDEFVSDLAALIASKSGDCLSIGKKAFYEHVNMPIEEAYNFANNVMAYNLQTTGRPFLYDFCKVFY